MSYFFWDHFILPVVISLELPFTKRAKITDIPRLHVHRLLSTCAVPRPCFLFRRLHPEKITSLRIYGDFERLAKVPLSRLVPVVNLIPFRSTFILYLVCSTTFYSTMQKPVKRLRDCLFFCKMGRQPYNYRIVIYILGFFSVLCSIQTWRHYFYLPKNTAVVPVKGLIFFRPDLWRDDLLWIKDTAMFGLNYWQCNESGQWSNWFLITFVSRRPNVMRRYRIPIEKITARPFPLRQRLSLSVSLSVTKNNWFVWLYQRVLWLSV